MASRMRRLAMQAPRLEGAPFPVAGGGPRQAAGAVVTGCPAALMGRWRGSRLRGGAGGFRGSAEDDEAATTGAMAPSPEPSGRTFIGAGRRCTRRSAPLTGMRSPRMAEPGSGSLLPIRSQGSDIAQPRRRAARGQLLAERRAGQAAPGPRSTAAPGGYSNRTLPGAVMRPSSGSVARMTASEAASPAPMMA